MGALLLAVAEIAALDLDEGRRHRVCFGGWQMASVAQPLALGKGDGHCRLIVFVVEGAARIVGEDHVVESHRQRIAAPSAVLDHGEQVAVVAEQGVGDRKQRRRVVERAQIVVVHTKQRRGPRRFVVVVVEHAAVAEGDIGRPILSRAVESERGAVHEIVEDTRLNVQMQGGAHRQRVAGRLSAGRRHHRGIREVARRKSQSVARLQVELEGVGVVGEL